MTMTNLQRWLVYAGLFAVPYLAIVGGVLQSPALHKWLFPIQVLPLLLLILFGVYSAGTVLYRTLTFNDCPEAAKELHEQIQEARRDLISKGFKFRD